MPPKIVKPPNQSKNKFPPQKMNQQQNQKNKNSKNSLKGKNFKLDSDEPKEEEEKKEEQPQKRAENAWIYEIKPIIQPDAELHKELSMKRRAAEKIKHNEICKRELYAILKFAMFTKDFKDPKAIRRERINFEKGKYVEEVNKEEENKNKPKINYKSTKSQYFTPPPVLTRYSLPSDVAINQLREKITNNEQKFEMNKQVDDLLNICNNGHLKFIEEVENKPLIDFPFIISILGPQCSGKTTIAQYIQSYFKVKIIKYLPGLTSSTNNTGRADSQLQSHHKEIKNQMKNEENKENDNDENNQSSEELHAGLDLQEIQYIYNTTDDKTNLQTILDTISELEEGYGLILINYPSTKGQLTQLDKGISSRNLPNFNALAGLIRIDKYDFDYYSNGRQLDLKSGKIFHNAFFPPGYISYDFEKECELVFYPSQKDNAYAKLVSNAQAIQKSLKKNVISYDIKESVFISELYQQVNDFITELFNTKNLTCEFPVQRYTSHQQFDYTSFLHDLLNFYQENMIKFYAEDLGDAYSQISSASKVADSIKSIAHDRFVLTMNMDDDRGSYTARFMKDLQNQYKYFNDIWDLANASRDQHYKDAEHILNSVGFNTIQGLAADGYQKLFSGLVKHYLTVYHFLNMYKAYIDDPEEPPRTILLPEFPSFDPSDLVTVSKLMFVDAFKKGVRPPPTFCAKEDKFKDGIMQTLVDRRRLKITTPYRNSSAANFKHVPVKKYNSAIQNFTSPLPLSNDKSKNTPLKAPPSQLSTSVEQFQQSPLVDEIKQEEETIPEVKYDHQFGKSLNFFDEEKCIADIKEFLQYIKDNNPLKAMRNESDVLIKIFDFFISEKDRIAHFIENGKDELLKQFKDMVLHKYFNEMEPFSANLLALIEKGDKSKPVFQYDYSQITGHLHDLMEIAGGIPNPDYPRYLTKQKLSKFLECSMSYEGGKKFLNIDDVRNIADMAGFGEPEKAELELIIRMTTNPDFVEAGPLCDIICNPLKTNEKPTKLQK